MYLLVESKELMNADFDSSVGETLMIGDEVTVTVLGVKGNQVPDWCECTEGRSVHREEIYMRIQAEKAMTRRGCLISLD